MKLTTFTDYSLRVLLYVATQPAGKATIAEIAQVYGVSEHHLVKVVHRLGREGLLRNTRGRGGGLALGRPSARINLGEVVRLMEGADQPAECFNKEGHQCVIARACRLAGVLNEAVGAFYAALDRYTLHDLVKEPQALVAILHPPRRAA